MTKKKFAVLGDPINHSLSPVIHLAAYKQLELDWRYESIQVHAGNLADFVGNQGMDFDGFSVTMPLKPEAAALGTISDGFVQELGVANTLVRSGSELSAFNTDVFGIVQALKLCWATNPKTIAVLGAGSTAQSALLAIKLKAPSATVTSYVRDSSNTQDLAKLAKGLGLPLNISDISEFGTSQDLTISTIPGHNPLLTPSQQNGWLLDVNYANPDQSLSESFAKAKVVTGKSMLLWQAIAQIRLFTSADANKELPDEVEVLRAMSAAL